MRRQRQTTVIFISESVWNMSGSGFTQPVRVMGYGAAMVMAGEVTHAVSLINLIMFPICRKISFKSKILSNGGFPFLFSRYKWHVTPAIICYNFGAAAQRRHLQFVIVAPVIWLSIDYKKQNNCQWERHPGAVTVNNLTLEATFS